MAFFQFCLSEVRERERSHMMMICIRGNNTNQPTWVSDISSGRTWQQPHTLLLGSAPPHEIWPHPCWELLWADEELGVDSFFLTFLVAYRHSPVSWSLLIFVACASLHFFLCSTLCVCTCAPVYGSQRLVFGIFFSYSHFMRQGLIDNWLDWQTTKPEGSACLSFLSAVITDVCSCTWPFTWVQIQARVLMFTKQVVCRVNHLPSPMCSTLMILMLYVVWDY